MKFPKPQPKFAKDRDYLDWIARQSKCATCKNTGVEHDTGEYLLSPSHIKTRKNGDHGNCIPQCFACHTLYGKLGVTLFNERFKCNLEQMADAYFVRYQNENFAN